MPAVKVGHCTSGKGEFKRACMPIRSEPEDHRMGLAIATGVVILAIVLVVAYIVRQLRRVKRMQAEIDYSKVRRWKDDDDEDEDGTR